MNLSDWLFIVVLMANGLTLGMCCVTLWQLHQLSANLDWMREWIARANHRLKELEDWIERL